MLKLRPGEQELEEEGLRQEVGPRGEASSGCCMVRGIGNKLGFPDWAAENLRTS